MMNEKIEIKFDKKINGYLVIMPDFITLKMIEDWKKRFDKELESFPKNGRYSLLIDTNKHQFESIECLKNLRDYLTNRLDFKQNVAKVAFVSPANFRRPQIKSKIEAYFDNFEQAYQWL